MKDLLRKEHCCYKIDILMKSSAYLPSVWTTRSFLSENLGSPHSVIFKKLQPPPINKGEFILEWPYTFTYEKTANGSTFLFFCSLKPLGGSKVDMLFVLPRSIK